MPRDRLHPSPPVVAPREYVDSIYAAVRSIDRNLDRATRDAGYRADIVAELRELDDAAHELADQMEAYAK